MGNDINIEEIMQEIRQNIKDKGYDKEPVSFEEIEMPQGAVSGGEGYQADVLLSELEYLNHNYYNQFHVPINGGNPFAVLIKKVIRKLTRFLVVPLVEFQNQYNASSLRCMNQMKEYITELETYQSRVEELEKELDAIKGKLS